MRPRGSATVWEVHRGVQLAGAREYVEPLAFPVGEGEGLRGETLWRRPAGSGSGPEARLLRKTERRVALSRAHRLPAIRARTFKRAQDLAHFVSFLGLLAIFVESRIVVLQVWPLWETAATKLFLAMRRTPGLREQHLGYSGRDSTEHVLPLLLWTAPALAAATMSTSLLAGEVLPVRRFHLADELDPTGHSLSFPGTAGELL